MTAFFDSASRRGSKGKMVAGVGVVFDSPYNHIISRAYSLIDSCSNNIAEYNALMIGLKIDKQLKVKYLKGYRDFQLVINQVKEEYEIKNKDLMPYYQAIIKMAGNFNGFYISHVKFHRNSYTDLMASLAATLALPKNAKTQIIVGSKELFCPRNELEAELKN